MPQDPANSINQIRRFSAVAILTPLLIYAGGICQAQTADSWESPTPGVTDYFQHPSAAEPQFTPTVQIALAPQPIDSQPSTNRLEPVSRVGSSGSLRDPVALVNYEEPVSVDGQSDNPKPASDPLEWDWLPPDDLTVDAALLDQFAASIENVRQSVTDESGESADNSATALANIKLASERLESARNMLARSEQLERETADAPLRQSELEEALNSKLPEPPVALDENLAIEVHQAALTEQSQTEQRIRNELAAVEAEIDERARLQARLGDRRVELREKLESAETKRQQLASEHPDQALLLENQSIAIVSILELTLCDVEQSWCAAMEKVGPLQRDNLQRQLGHAVATKQALDTLVGELRSKLARAEEKRARRAAADAHPLVEDLARENAKLAEDRSQLAELIQKDGAAQKELDAILESVASSHEKLEDHVAAAGHSQAVGIMLRHHRTQLPPTNTHRIRINQIRSRLPDISLQQLDSREQREGLSAAQAELHQKIAAMDLPPEGLEQMADELLATKRKYLNDLESDYVLYVTGLSSLETSHNKAIKSINELRLFIDQHVLWIRSAQPLDAGVFRESVCAVKAIAATAQWEDLVNGLEGKLMARWPLLLMIGLGLWLAVGMRQQLDRRLRDVSRRRHSLRVSPIARSLTLTLLQASFLPGVVATLGWLLSDPFEMGSLKDSISRGLLVIVPQLFIGSAIYRFCIRGGLAESQLNWPAEVTSVVRAAAGRILRYCLPLLAITYTLELFDTGRWGDSLGRIVFIVAMICFSWASFLLLRGMGRCWRRDPQSSRSVWVQTFGLWAPVVILAPLALACVAALGYHYSSVFLAGRLLKTWWVLLGVVSIYHFASRLVDIGQNIINARRRWGGGQGADDETTRDEQFVYTEDLLIKAQVGRLLHVTSIAVFLVVVVALWVEVMPAISALDHGVWGPIERQVTMLNSEGLLKTDTRLDWITIGDLLMCGLILTATVIVSRNLPGLLEMIVLDRLPLDRGGKYAISIVCRYLVAAIGIVIASRTIGFSWHSVQWLVAAMGVGLGFGLQEIFANFISGIIILLERPIRAGDLVTVNGTTGFVTKMQLRATTIMDYDRRELIVPNKKFITDDVINWTLTDSITRMIIKVGIAYGSDTKLAQRSLLKVARQHPEILPEPAPQVIFQSFGASSLDFELRVHIPDRLRYPEMVHELHMAVDEEFRRQKIEIAFPQQDVHVRGLEHLAGIPAVNKENGDQKAA